MQALPKVQLDIDLGHAQRAKLHSMHSQVFYPKGFTSFPYLLLHVVLAFCQGLFLGLAWSISNSKAVFSSSEQLLFRLAKSLKTATILWPRHAMGRLAFSLHQGTQDSPVFAWQCVVISSRAYFILTHGPLLELCNSFNSHIQKEESMQSLSSSQGMRLLGMTSDTSPL